MGKVDMMGFIVAVDDQKYFSSCPKTQLQRGETLSFSHV